MVESSEITSDNQISLNKAILVVILTITILLGIGYGIGVKFFWNQYDTQSISKRQLDSLKDYTAKNPKNKISKMMLFDRYFSASQNKESTKVLDQLKKVIILRRLM